MAEEQKQSNYEENWNLMQNKWNPQKSPKQKTQIVCNVIEAMYSILQWALCESPRTC